MAVTNNGIVFEVVYVGRYLCRVEVISAPPGKPKIGEDISLPKWFFPFPIQQGMILSFDIKTQRFERGTFKDIPPGIPQH